MSALVYTACKCYVDGYDFTTDTNSISLKDDIEEQDVTTFGSGGYKERIAGLHNIDADLKGLWQSAASASVDSESFPALGTADLPVSVGTTGTEGETAYLYRAGKFDYEVFGEVGEAAPFSLKMMGTNAQGLVRGAMALNKTTVSSTGAKGTALNLGAVGATQFLYAAFHVLSAGTTVTVLVESDSASDFASPTTVATIGPLTAVGGTWMTRVAGALTDTWYRFNVSAITGTFSLAGSIGIR